MKTRINWASIAVIVFLTLIDLGTQWNYHVAARQRDQALAAGQALLKTAKEGTEVLRGCVAQLKDTAAALATSTQSLVADDIVMQRQDFIIRGATPRTAIANDKLHVVPYTSVLGPVTTGTLRVVCCDCDTQENCTSKLQPAKSHAYSRITENGVVTCYDQDAKTPCVAEGHWPERGRGTFTAVPGQNYETDLPAGK